MEIDLDTLSDGEARDYDICILGSGPAAFALALQFVQQTARPGLRVAMLESSSTASDNVRDLYHGINAGLLENSPHWPPDYCFDSRLRTYGGTSGHWGGWSWPLEPYNLTGEIVAPQWPIAYDELLEYYRRAQQSILRLGAFEYDNPQYWIDNSTLELEAMPLAPGSPLRTRILQFNKVRFAGQYGDRIRNSRLVDVYRNANVTSLESAPTGSTRRVTGMVAQTIVRGRPGQSNRFSAKYFVVAAGGIETTRFLLLNEFGNQSGHLGQHFMDHPYLDAATFTVNRERIPDGVYNFYFGAAKVDPNRRDIAMQSLPALGRGATFIAGLVPTPEFLRAKKISGFRVLLGGVGNPPGVIHTNIEPLPTTAGTISLSDRTDPVFEQAQVKVDWQLTPNASDTGEAMLDATCETLATLGYGSDFKRPPIEDRVWGPGLHPMGTTRMAQHPKDGVVDGNLRVFDTSNLYVTSSSTFSTAGYQNPTFTICALALRLADYLKTGPAS